MSDEPGLSYKSKRKEGNKNSTKLCMYYDCISIIVSNLVQYLAYSDIKIEYVCCHFRALYNFDFGGQTH